jgi:nucleotide-binding universal stress UspA family protein
MPTASVTAASAFSAYHPSLINAGPILVASDASPHADAAFPLAEALAAHTGDGVRIVSAIQPFSMPMYAFDVMPVSIETDAGVRAGREGMLRAQLGKLVDRESTWPIDVRTGEPAREIVDYARDVNARVVIVGRGRHTALQRALSGETVLRLLQLGDTPVYAAEAGTTSLAERVVVATDFSEFSTYAAQIALSLISPTARVILVHVAPPFAESDPLLQERAIAYRNQTRQAFAQLREHLARPGLTFEELLVHGHPVDQITKAIRANNADLVVSATHGYGFLRRMILGSVAAELVRHAPCSVLCVPGSARTLAAARGRVTLSVTTRAFGADVLDEELGAFADRNMARPCTVEIDQSELGAQILGHGLPLVGATYDAHDRAVTLMFGAAGLTGQHLSHRVPCVSAISVTTDTSSREQILRIANDGGQTLVLLE